MAAPAAPPPTAPPTPTPSPAPATKAPQPPAVADTPMTRMRARMNEASVEADLSDPDPLKTVKERKKSPEPTKPKAQEEPPKPAQTPTAHEDPLETDEPTPPIDKTKAEAPKPEDETISDDELKSSKPPEKAGPWKLKKYWEKRAAAIEMERNALQEKLSKLPNIERLEAIDKRNKELEEEIRYHNYAKSQEYQEKYAKPYEEAWAKAISDLGELEVLAEDGSTARKATANDLISLARMPLGEARKLANQMFGDSASDVMMHRQKIRDLSDAQHKALEDAKKTGSEREAQWTEKAKSIYNEASTLWNKFNEEDAAKLEFLQAKEGDTEWNAKLEKAKSMADAVSAQNPLDHNLTPEQRAKIIRLQAAQRNRAIAYSPMKLEIARLKAQLKERDEKLKQFEDSEPTGGQTTGSNGKPVQASTPMERARQRLHASSVPAPQYF